MYSDNTTEKFRQSYRATISPLYNGYLHMMFVLLAGLLFIAYQFSFIKEFHWYYSLGIGATLVLWNFTEYFIHVKLGHKKRRFAALFYKRHTGDHHSFFSDKNLVPQDHKDWRVTLFPAWLVIVVGLIAGAAGKAVGIWVGSDWGALFSASFMIGYLSYEFFHFCDHLPQNNPLAKLPWIGHMRHLHKLHHRRDLMHTHNFNLTFPLADWVLGTFYWIPPEKCAPEVN